MLPSGHNTLSQKRFPEMVVNLKPQFRRSEERASVKTREPKTDTEDGGASEAYFCGAATAVKWKA